MKHTRIGSRLLMAASFVENGNTVCDVGCDHGKLSLYLVKEQKAKQIIATDINKQPLEKAIKLFAENNLSEKGRFLLTDGLQNIENTQDITHIVIAGLGGETMANVLQAAPFVKKQKIDLVLVPAQSGSRIRKYLYENGFSILEEKTVSENKKFYTCIHARYTQDYKTPSIYECYIGKSEENKGESALGYFQMVLSQLEKQEKGQRIDLGKSDLLLQQAIKKVKTLLITS